MDDRLYLEKVFLLKAELKRALSMLALKEHFEFRVKKSCHARFEVGCKDKACKFALRATKLPKGEYWHFRTLHKKIMEEMNRKWGLRCLYGKAWQAKEYVESFVFDPPEESFQLLLSYFHMLERENLGTVTCVTIDREQQFKYCFWAFGSCIRGFSAIMRPVVAIDATHLKGRFKGILFVAHLGIKNVVEKVYKDTHHGLCNYHLGKNVKNRFKHEDVAVIFTMAANYYRARAQSSVRRCKLMTSKTVECVNSCLRHARKMPITILIECIRGMFQRWFHDQHNEALNLTTPLNPWATDLLNRRFNEACHFFVQAIDWVKFQVIGESKDRVVNLSTKECSCGEFQFDLLPCTHAMATISKCKCAAIEFCSDYYKTPFWAEGYAVPIRLVGHPSEWDIPDDVQQNVVLPLSWLSQAGRPRRKRIPSVGEGSGRRRCSQCKNYGHNRQNYRTPFASLPTNWETSSA
ncbi:PREDICTED: uncharacterized protein LOC108661988 [Theobroma cacao]|uniref:Uncharacterized protein LOC108661988 n=1 Tax=Theobroma cacao TaxID=3641 RepID=A0AB32WC69_THECC|nr:PREDICTED: uncharacterized protein LOC108661988 [Theobroma cacao]